MTYRKCKNCYHHNGAAAGSCESCEFPLSDADTFESGDPFAGWGTSPRGGEGGGPRPGPPPTDIPSPRFMAAGDVISPTLEIYRKHFPLVGALVAATTLPVALLKFSLGRGARAAPTGAAIAAAVLRASAEMDSLFMTGLSFAASALLSAALVYAVLSVQRTGSAAAGASLWGGLCVLPNVFLATLFCNIAVGIGYMLFVIPGIVLNMMYAVAVPAAVAEGRGPLNSLSRSAHLTNGYKGRIFVTYFLWGVLIYAVNLMVSVSFAYGGAGNTLPAILVQSIVGGMLNASLTVLSVYIFLGILNERRPGFAPGAYAPDRPSGPRPVTVSD